LEFERELPHQSLLPGEKVARRSRDGCGELCLCPTPAPAGHPLPRERAFSNIDYFNNINSHAANAAWLSFVSCKEKCGIRWIKVCIYQKQKEAQNAEPRSNPCDWF